MMPCFPITTDHDSWVGTGLLIIFINKTILYILVYFCFPIRICVFFPVVPLCISVYLFIFAYVPKIHQRFEVNLCLGVKLINDLVFVFWFHNLFLNGIKDNLKENEKKKNENFVFSYFYTARYTERLRICSRGSV